MQHLTDPERAAAELASGALLVHPTQGLWGIAADPLSERGMGRLAALKGTTRAGFITVAAGADQLDGWYRDDNGADKLLRTAWRGPVTFVLPAGVRAPAPIIAALAQIDLPPATFVWIAAEAGVARAAREYLVETRGLDKRWIKAAGYWVAGQADSSAKNLGEADAAGGH